MIRQVLFLIPAIAAQLAATPSPELGYNPPPKAPRPHIGKTRPALREFVAPADPVVVTRAVELPPPPVPEMQEAQELSAPISWVLASPPPFPHAAPAAGRFLFWKRKAGKELR